MIKVIVMLEVIVSQSKVCEMCGGVFVRPKKCANTQWSGRRFCSKKCSATRLSVDIRKVISDYMSGKSSSDIAEEMGASARHVRRMLKMAGVQIRTLSESKKALMQNNPKERERVKKMHPGFLSDKARDALRIGQQPGPKNPRWKGGTTLSVLGYEAYTKSKTNGRNGGRLVHRVLAEQAAGRQLRSDEHVHHIDGNKRNNAIENLVIISATEHAKIHSEDRLNGKKRLKSM